MAASAVQATTQEARVSMLCIDGSLSGMGWAGKPGGQRRARRAQRVIASRGRRYYPGDDLQRDRFAFGIAMTGKPAGQVPRAGSLPAWTPASPIIVRPLRWNSDPTHPVKRARELPASSSLRRDDARHGLRDRDASGR